MKKLLLASIIMIGVSGFASAQTPETVRAKKEAVKRDANQPAMTNAAKQTTPPANKVVKAKTDYQIAKEAEAKKAIQPAKVEEVKKTKEN